MSIDTADKIPEGNMCEGQTGNITVEQGEKYPAVGLAGLMTHSLTIQ